MEKILFYRLLYVIHIRLGWKNWYCQFFKSPDGTVLMVWKTRWTSMYHPHPVYIGPPIDQNMDLLESSGPLVNLPSSKPCIPLISLVFFFFFLCASLSHSCCPRCPSPSFLFRHLLPSPSLSQTCPLLLLHKLFRYHSIPTGAY